MFAVTLRFSLRAITQSYGITTSYCLNDGQTFFLSRNQINTFILVTTSCPSSHLVHASANYQFFSRAISRDPFRRTFKQNYGDSMGYYMSCRADRKISLIMHTSRSTGIFEKRDSINITFEYKCIWIQKAQKESRQYMEKLGCFSYIVPFRSASNEGFSK